MEVNYGKPLQEFRVFLLHSVLINLCVYIETWMAVWRVDLQCFVGVGILLGFWLWHPCWRFNQGRSLISAVPGTSIRTTPRAGSAAKEKAADSGSPPDYVWNSVWKTADSTWVLGKHQKPIEFWSSRNLLDLDLKCGICHLGVRGEREERMLRGNQNSGNSFTKVLREKQNSSEAKHEPACGRTTGLGAQQGRKSQIPVIHLFQI